MIESLNQNYLEHSKSVQSFQAQDTNMSSASTDTGTSELDTLIHSLEFENQQFVKMIEKENQLLSSLESQIQEKAQQMSRLNEEVTHMDEETKRLHGLYTSNRNNIGTLKNTLTILSDHELALTKQLEAVKITNEAGRKFYTSQVKIYSNIRDEYMKKYTSFQLAQLLEQRNKELANAGKKLDSIRDAKLDVKNHITVKENELDRRVMTRIVVKIAKMKLEAIQQEKQIHECLAEKTELFDKLKEIRTSRDTGQTEQCQENAEKTREEQSMDTGEVAPESEAHNTEESVEIERFAHMNIRENADKVSRDKGPLTEPEHMPELEEVCMSTLQDQQLPDGMPTWPEKNKTLKVPNSSNSVQPVPAVDQRDKKQSASKQATPPARDASYTSQPSFSSHIQPSLAVSTQKTEPRRIIREVPASTTTTSLHLPKLSVPRPPRVLPPPVVRAPPVAATAGPRPTTPSQQMKQPPPPSPEKKFMDFKHRLSGLIPKTPSVPQPNFSNTLKLTTSTVPALTEKRLEYSNRPIENASFQMKSPLVKPPLQPATIGVSVSKTDGNTGNQTQTSDTSIRQKMDRPGLELESPVNKNPHESTVQLEEPSLRLLYPKRAVCSPGHSSVPFPRGSYTEITTDVQVPTKGCDTPLTGPEKPAAKLATNSPVAQSATSPRTQVKSNSQSPSSFQLRFESLLGNFDKNTSQQSSPNEEETGPTSIFSLFNVSQPSSCGTEEDASEEPFFFTLGKFTEEADSPNSDGAPHNLLNLFTQPANSGTGFALNFQGDNEEQEGAANSESSSFQMKEDGLMKNFFSLNRAEDNDEDKPMFNLF